MLLFLCNRHKSQIAIDKESKVIVLLKYKLHILSMEGVLVGILESKLEKIESSILNFKRNLKEGKTEAIGDIHSIIEYAYELLYIYEAATKEDKM